MTARKRSDRVLTTGDKLSRVSSGRVICYFAVPLHVVRRAMAAAVSSGGVWVIVAERGCKCAFPKVGREGREKLVEGPGILAKG